MNQQPSFHQHLTAWKWAVAGKSHAPLPPEIVAASQEEFTLWSNQLAQAKVDANNAGFQCQFNKGSKPGRSAAWVASGGHTLKVVFMAKVKRPQAVTATSREAYKTVDLGERCEAVARAAIKLGVCTDNEIARALNMVPSSVSARRNDIENADGITIDGVLYKLRMEGSRVDPITQRRANTWALLTFNHSDRNAALQTTLFQ